MYSVRPRSMDISGLGIRNGMPPAQSPGMQFGGANVAEQMQPYNIHGVGRYFDGSATNGETAFGFGRVFEHGTLNPDSELTVTGVCRKWKNNWHTQYRKGMPVMAVNGVASDMYESASSASDMPGISYRPSNAEQLTLMTVFQANAFLDTINKNMITKATGMAPKATGATSVFKSPSKTAKSPIKPASPPSSSGGTSGSLTGDAASASLSGAGTSASGTPSASSSSPATTTPATAPPKTVAATGSLVANIKARIKAHFNSNDFGILFGDYEDRQWASPQDINDATLKALVNSCTSVYPNLMWCNGVYARRHMRMFGVVKSVVNSENDDVVYVSIVPMGTTQTLNYWPGARQFDDVGFMLTRMYEVEPRTHSMDTEMRCLAQVLVPWASSMGPIASKATTHKMHKEVFVGSASDCYTIYVIGKVVRNDANIWRDCIIGAIPYSGSADRREVQSKILVGITDSGIDISGAFSESDNNQLSMTICADARSIPTF